MPTRPPWGSQLKLWRELWRGRGSHADAPIPVGPSLSFWSYESASTLVAGGLITHKPNLHDEKNVPYLPHLPIWREVTWAHTWPISSPVGIIRSVRATYGLPENRSQHSTKPAQKHPRTSHLAVRYNDQQSNLPSIQHSRERSCQCFYEHPSTITSIYTVLPLHKSVET